jgi:hypothetical protein
MRKIIALLVKNGEREVQIIDILPLYREILAIINAEDVAEIPLDDGVVAVCDGDFSTQVIRAYVGWAITGSAFLVVGKDDKTGAFRSLTASEINHYKSEFEDYLNPWTQGGGANNDD